MKTETTLDLKTLEKSLVDTIRTLHPRRAAEVLDFARWLQTQPQTDEFLTDGLSPAELAAEEEAWQATYNANREEFRAMAREALNELDAGETLGMVVREGKIYPE
jgi:siderophore synthetase component